MKERNAQFLLHSGIIMQQVVKKHIRLPGFYHFSSRNGVKQPGGGITSQIGVALGQSHVAEPQVSGGGLANMFTSMLDADGDGSAMDDLAELAGKFLNR